VYKVIKNMHFLIGERADIKGKRAQRYKAVVSKKMRGVKKSISTHK